MQTRLLIAFTSFIAMLAVAPTSHASTWRIDVNLASVHTEHWARDELNQHNPGLGLEWSPNRSWLLAGGIYKNSYRRPTVYGFAGWLPLQLGHRGHWRISGGAVAGLTSGYKRSEVPCAPFAAALTLRLTAPSGFGLNVYAVPNSSARSSGFIGFQLAVPLSN